MKFWERFEGVSARRLWPAAAGWFLRRQRMVLDRVSVGSGVPSRAYGLAGRIWGSFFCVVRTRASRPTRLSVIPPGGAVS